MIPNYKITIVHYDEPLQDYKIKHKNTIINI